MAKILNKASLVFILPLIALNLSGCLGISNNKNDRAVANGHQGVFKSVDGGKTWEQRVKIDENNRIDGVSITNIFMDPNNKETLYVGTKSSGLFKSENAAENWQKVEGGLLSSNAAVYDLAVEKGNSQVIYLAVLQDGVGELLKTTNGGKEWLSSHIISQEGKAVSAVAIDPFEKNVVYIGTEQGGFLKSVNWGKEWVSIHWFENPVRKIIFDYTNNNGVFVKTDKTIFKSVNKGLEWSDLGKKINSKEKGGKNYGVDMSKISSLTMDPNNPLVLYVSYLNFMLRSDDGGESWKKLNTITPSQSADGSIPQIKRVGISKVDSRIIYYGAGSALYKSEDFGESCMSYRIPIKGDVRYTLSDPENKDVLYIVAFYTPPPKKKKNPFLPY